MLDYLRGLESSGIQNRIRQLGLLVAAVDLLMWSDRQRIDHIHGHSCADTAHILALARRAGGPSYSLTLHGDLDVYGTDHKSKMEGAAFVCTVGSHLRKQVLDRVGLPSSQVVVTCMGVETSELASLGKHRSHIPGSLHLVTVARLNQMKGHVHALAAIQRGIQLGLDLRYTIAGDGPYRESILSQVAKLGLQDRVTLTGTQSEAEVYQLLSDADAFVLPSVGTGEAWPVSVMEAMGAGLPVIASQIGATREMINSGVDGFLVAQGDEQAILEKIVALAQNVDMRIRIGEAARGTAGQRFDVAITAATLLEAIMLSLGRQRRAQSQDCLPNQVRRNSVS
jgi:colanic acid/amylovoran biosynthesis glycosyltransferase